MAGRGARSDRGNVRGALVDEFTHVITGGTTRNCVLKQSSTLLRRCSALCRGGRPASTAAAGAAPDAYSDERGTRAPRRELYSGRRQNRLFCAPRERPDSLSARRPVLGRELAFRKNGYVWRQSPVAAIARYPPIWRQARVADNGISVTPEM
jgi:hypothetical protein